MLASHFQVKALLKYPGGLPLFSVENSTFLKNSGPRTLRQKNNEVVLHCVCLFFFCSISGNRKKLYGQWLTKSWTAVKKQQYCLSCWNGTFDLNKIMCVLLFVYILGFKNKEIKWLTQANLNFGITESWVIVFHLFSLFLPWVKNKSWAFRVWGFTNPELKFIFALSV